ncbi:hypothetical protein FA95DRAFT_1486386 [Auriscalpium vulgare]|uniref:Uncharacterized protein n=1 Tax=Auriscalpium vulgare TaxID=40419 RepID=A0ACB8S385_9AGAM|nr:hypothetical protein FA95DRAFT_1486386 [Auriscalpium vulgare]
MSSSVKRTYSSRSRPAHRSSSPSELASSPAKPSRKRPLTDHLSLHNTQPTKKARFTASSVAKSKPKLKSRAKGKEDRKPTGLTQLHFSLDTSVLRTCPLCDLTYTKGAPDDERMHKSHCARVERGMEWGREEERSCGKGEVREIATAVKLKHGGKGRIISVPADAGGKVGSKLAVLLETISLHLSSPALTSDILRLSKIYLFLLPSPTSSTREKIVGCVVATRITGAMAIAPASEVERFPATDTPGVLPPTATLVAVDTSTGLFCRPALLPTPMGIPRVFVPSAHRRQGIAAHLLAAAASTFVHGCKLDPRRGDVAFTQPTGAGKALMESWGAGGIRIYQE